MTKRSGNFDDFSSKKPKLDDLWDDDLDEDALDNCFEIATQIVQQQDINSTQFNNISLLSNYSAFKPPNGVFTSTQLTGPINVASSGVNLEQRVKDLQQKYEEKEGEVSILRTNLREIKTTNQSEQEKRQNEWKERLTRMEKSKKAVQSELEFKNLEVANLRQKINELSRLVASNDKLPVKRAPSVTAKCPQPPDSAVPSRIAINTPTCHPLKHVDFTNLRLSPSEKYRAKLKYDLSKNTSFFQKQVKDESNLVPSAVMINGRQLDLDFIYPEICYLVGCSTQQINTSNSDTINKIMIVTFQMTADFCNYLRKLEEDVQLHEIQEADSAYLNNNNKANFVCGDKSPHLNDELGIKPAKAILFISELLPFSSYLADYVICNKLLHVDMKADYATLLPCMQTGDYKKVDFLSLILHTVQLIGKMRKGSNCSLFLTSVIQLICRAFSTEKADKSISTICKIVQELLLSHPSFDVVCKLAHLLQIGSTNGTFVDFLCFRPTSKKTKTNTTKGVIYFMPESCPFHVFAVLLENMLSKIDGDSLPSGLNTSLLGFIHNVFEANTIWLSQGTECDCLCHLYKLALQVIHKNIGQYRHLKDNPEEEARNIIRCSINILNLLVFNSYDLVEAYIMGYAQFRDILHTLANTKVKLEDLDDLERLNLNDSEDTPNVAPEAFTEINF